MNDQTMMIEETADDIKREILEVLTAVYDGDLDSALIDLAGYGVIDQMGYIGLLFIRIDVSTRLSNMYKIGFWPPHWPC